MGSLSKCCMVTATLVATCSGASAWQRNMHEGSQDSAYAVKIDGAGDVVAIGTIRASGISSGFSVVKFAGADGAVLWRTDIAGMSGEDGGGYGLELDAS